METMEPTRELVQSPLDAEPIPSKGVLPSRFCILRFQDERLAVELSQVREICKLESVTSVPGMPQALVGVANLRGNIVPVVDLYPSLGLPGAAGLRYAVVVRQGARHVGILVQDVPEIQTAEFVDLVEMPCVEWKRACPFVSRVVKTAGRTIGVLDVPRLLAMLDDGIERQAA